MVRFRNDTIISGRGPGALGGFGAFFSLDPNISF